MHEHAGRVQHASQRRPARSGELLERPRRRAAPARGPPGSPRAHARAPTARRRPRARAARPRAARRASSRSIEGRSRGACPAGRSVADDATPQARQGANERGAAAALRADLRAPPRDRASPARRRRPCSSRPRSRGTRMPMCRAAMTSGTVDIPARSPPTARMKPDLGRRLELRPEPRPYTPSPSSMPEPRGRLTRSRAQLRVVRVAHVREARPERRRRSARRAAMSP